MDVVKSEQDHEKEKNEKILLFENGFPAFFILFCIAFLLTKALDFAWLNAVSVVLVFIYIIAVVFFSLTKKHKAIFAELKNSIKIATLVIIPLILSLAIYVLYITVLINHDPQINFLDFTKGGGYNTLVVLFFVLSSVGIVYLLSMQNNINTINKNIEEANGDCELVKSSFNGQALCAQIETMAKETQTVVSSIEMLSKTIESKATVALAATCIPIKRMPGNDNGLVFCLIKNESYTKSAWMFPGGHLDLKKNLPGVGGQLQSMQVTPVSIIQQRVKDEAGLMGLTLLNLIDPTGTDVFPDTYLPVVSPVFNNLFQISENAKCYKQYGHECHYDLTYVGSYTDIEYPRDDKYDFTEFEIKCSDVNFESEQHFQAVGAISSKLAEHINKKESDGSKKRKVQQASALFFDSIPYLIYNTLKYYDQNQLKF